MGYRCPVCETPQPDAEHLANHVAFTGLMGDGDHERWLDEHVTDWAAHDPESLGETLADIVPSVELEDIGSEGHEGRGRPSVDTVSAGKATDEDLDPVTAAALAEAREMTQEMVGGSEAESEESGDSSGTDRAEGEDR